MLKAKHHTIPFIFIYFSFAYFSNVRLRLDKQRLKRELWLVFYGPLFAKTKMKIWLFSSMGKIGTAYLQCLLNVSRVLLRNFRLLLTRSVTNLWWSWMPMYILQVSSQVKRCSLDLVRTTELRIFNKLNVYKCSSSVGSLLFFSR